MCHFVLRSIAEIMLYLQVVRVLKNVGYQRKLILDCKAFGVKKYIYKNKDPKEKVLNKINWEADI